MRLETLHDKITSLLMENGAAVTKPSVDAIVKFIAERDQHTIDQVIREAEKSLARLQGDEFHGTRIEE